MNAIRHTASVLGRRLTAAATLTSTVLHARMLADADGFALKLLLGAMVVGCAYCTLPLWSGPTLRTWLHVALMNLATIALHLDIADCRPSDALDAAAGSVEVSTVPTVTIILAAIEVGIATVVLLYRTRGHGPRRDTAVTSTT